LFGFIVKAYIEFFTNFKGLSKLSVYKSLSSDHTNIGVFEIG